MATVNSLICWGGLTGKTGFSINTATDQVTLVKHGLMTGLSVFFSAGTLPTVSGTALALNTRYYPKWISNDVFELYYDAALATKVDFTSTGSGLYLKTGLILTPADLSRWGSTRIYDSLKSWNTARSAAAVATDTEVAEIGEAFRDHMTDYSLDISVLASSVRIEAKVNGVRSSAHHNGSITGGYEFLYSNYNGLTALKYNIEFDGFRIKAGVAGSYAISLNKRNCSVRNLVVDGTGAAGSVVGINCVQGPATIEYNVVVNCGQGLVLYEYEGPFYVRNNLFAKNGKGVEARYSGAYPVYGFIYNNIAVGNTTYDWSTQPTGIDGANMNAGAGTQAWMTTGGSRVTIATTDFVNYSSNDFRPALSTSPQVEVGTGYYAPLPYDIAGNEVPNYMNGGAEVTDIGPYEFDHGYGNHPATATINLTNLVSGSQVRITKDTDNSVIYNNAPGTSLSFSTSYIGGFSVTVRKASASPYYREFNASGTTVAGQTTTIKCLQQLDE